MNKKLQFKSLLLLAVMLLGASSAWAAGTLIRSLSDITEGTYYITALSGENYYTVPNTTIAGQTFTCTEGSFSENTLTPASGAGEFVFTAVDDTENAFYIYNTNLKKYLVATGSKTFGYVENTSNDYGYWTFSTVSSGGFSGVFSVQHSSKTHYMRAYNNSVRCYDSANNSGVYLFKKTETAVADPSFLPGGGAYTSTQNVTLSCTTENATIHYTLDNTEPTASSSTYTSPISISKTTTIKAIAFKGSDASAVVSATYTIVQINNAGTAEDPYTVADARNAIDANTGLTDVYATGIVSEIVTEYSNQHGNITFNISADGLTTSDQLQAYRCKGGTGVDVSGVKVGDVVLIKGTLKKYGDTYEFGEANELISLEHPVSAVADPTFTPEAGAYTSAQNVTLACTTEGATIYYTIDGTAPTASSSTYSSAISVNSTTTIKAIAIKDGNTSSIVSATYLITEHAGTADDPYTVADARNAIDAKIGTTEVYATGIVSEIVTSYSSEHKNITFNISADGLQAGNQLQAFRCEKATDADVDVSDVRVGDIVIIYGNLKKFNTTYEFDQGNNLVSLTRPVVSKITVAPTNVEATEFQKSGILEVTYQNCEANSPSVKFYNAEGTTEVSCDWIQVTINEDNNFDYIINANQGDARTAYLKICNNGVYSNLVTVTQSAAAAPATLPFSWAGGIKTDLEAMTGVLTVDAGTNYAESNAPYRVKFDNSNRNILIKTDSQPGIVTVGVKMLGGNKTSSIIVQESANGSTFENVDELSISGSQNDIVNLVTTKLCQPTTRYIKLCFNKGEGSNVGVGPITITKTTIPVTISAAGWATLYTGCALNFEGTGLTAYTATLEGTTVTLNSVSSVPAGTGVVLKGAPQNYEIPVVGSSESAKGDLKGSTSEDIEATGKYILVQNGSNVEFAKATSGTIKAGKAYLEKTSSARILNVVLAGEATGIKSIETVQESNKVYNLNGQRVAAPQKGLYILNGKKVIIK